MKSSSVLATTISTAILAGLLFHVPATAQDQANSGGTTAPSVKRSFVKKKVTDPLRSCKNREKQPDVPEGELIFYSTSWGNNPQEGQYRQEMERLLRIEISNVGRSLQDVHDKHKELIRLYPEFASYQEIILEDVPGTWRDGVYVNSKRLIIFHYDEEKDLDCVVLDSMTRNIYGANEWTRKLIRLYYPNIQTMELQTLRHNYVLEGTLEQTSPEVQLRALRLVFLNLRTALYSMDMMIAAYYDLRNKKNEWQINL
jgi:hypothetical protein